MVIKFSELLDLFEIVNFGLPYSHEGYISKITGKTYYYSDFSDDQPDLPADIGDQTKYLAIPQKNDLNLGRELALDFVQKFLPSEFENARSFFHRKGAYSRFKTLLENHGKTEEWYKYEKECTERALREWCIEQNVEIDG
ncbi:hypothetical protein FCV66_24230 [Enterovibrio norvegicus]|uniref:hypothetical protein n=1 Tax=Enterovibrio norvegicus TaxID=188144 RepID=UPI000C83A638|nr:hypothetical protein [Enterovibrio norvegicus]PMI35258.1 hypothetical protein BCU47_23825 [Enterovibrio norvegicus]TKF03904.1 hypothetical protein FCV66_24230 [Enterovibrio norvegicus]